MQANKSSDKRKIFCRATTGQRLVSGILFLFITGIFVVLWLAGAGKIDLGFILDPCGAKQRYGLPCPTCGITTSAMAFASGKILKAFYIQPGGSFYLLLFDDRGIFIFINIPFWGIFPVS